ncbi:hypothetical protein [Flavobacterium sp. 1355]|uniref:hypothetical protein n=1 Tax=Flavobacterium sp. 1355 TaxID=2806571 RepID=UPI001AE5A3C6|nr:hypothetical protein [Flavobacterium sp. 1355]MBP1224144.1 hypothetical protein [Flavobacterium sp. 1355]
MVKKLLKVIFVLIFTNSIYAQESNHIELKEKSNPIVYAEAFGGFSCMDHFGLIGGGELNYQYKKDIFSFRYSHLAGYVKRDSVFSFANVEDNDEYALLYGKRWSNNSHSFSVSAGVSSNNLKLTSRDFDNFQYERFYGMPFEANFKWFYPKRKSHLIYNALIPSIGIKFFGTISKHTFVGVGLSLGFGFSKKYSEEKLE